MSARSEYVMECPVCAERGTRDEEGKPIIVRACEPKAVCAKCGAELIVENWGKL